MKRYLVTTKEIMEYTYEVEAESSKDALAEIDKGNGEVVGQPFFYDYYNDPEDWDLEEIND